MNMMTFKAKGMLDSNDTTTYTDITVRFTDYKIGDPVLALHDEMSGTTIAIQASGLLWRLKLIMSNPRRYGANNLLKQDKERKQEDEKQEDTGE